MPTAKTVSLTTPSSFQTQQQAIDRQRKLAELLQQEALTPSEGQMVSGWYVPPNPLQHAAKLAKALASAYQNKQLDDKETELASSQNKALADGIMNYQKHMQGESEQSFPIMDDEYGAQTATAPAVPGNKQAALASLIGNQHPTLQSLGVQMALADAKPTNNFSKVDPKDYTQESVAKFAQSGNYADLVPIRKKEVAPNGQVYDPYGVDETKTFKKAPDGFAYNEQGVLVVEPAWMSAKKEIARAGKTDVNVSTAGPKAFEIELGKLDAERLGELRKGAETAHSALSTVANMREAIKQGVYSGGGAQAKTAAANLINGITGITPKELPGSEQFIAEASKLVLDSIKSLGANPSNADREFIEQTIPQLGTSPQARDKLIDFMEQKAKKSIDLYQRADAYARENRGFGGFNMFEAPTPNPKPPSAGGGLSAAEREELQQLRKRLKGNQ